MSDDEQPDFGALARRARQMQHDMSSIQSDLNALQTTGFGGGGLVTATVSGEGRLIALQMDPSVINPDDPETLAELVIAAVDGANEAMAERRSERMTEVTDGLQSLIAGLRPVPPTASGSCPGSPLGVRAPQRLGQPPAGAGRRRTPPGGDRDTERGPAGR